MSCGSLARALDSDRAEGDIQFGVLAHVCLCVGYFGGHYFGGRSRSPAGPLAAFVLSVGHVSVHVRPFRMFQGHVGCPNSPKWPPNGLKNAFYHFSRSQGTTGKLHLLPTFYLPLVPNRLTFEAFWDIRRSQSSAFVFGPKGPAPKPRAKPAGERPGHEGTGAK